MMRTFTKLLCSICMTSCCLPYMAQKATPTTPQPTPATLQSSMVAPMKDNLLFVSIIPLFPGEEDYLANLIIERHRKTGIENYAMSYAIDPKGTNLMEPIDIQATSFHKLKEKLKAQPMKLGILFQATIGHGGYWNPTPGDALDAQRIIRLDGTPTAHCCPFDPVFLDYIKTAAKRLLDEKPDFTLCDDDMRLNAETCCCPRHLAYLSKLMGKTYTRDMLARELKNAKPFDKISRCFAEAQKASILKLGKTIRQAIDESNPELQSGCCIVATAATYAADLAQTLAAKNQTPIIRINNGYYLEGPIKTQGWVNFRTGVQVAFLKTGENSLLDESDTCPHSRFSKSARTMNLHILSGLVRGLDGGKLWFDNSTFPLREISRQYEDIFARNRKLYDKIHQLARDWKPQGMMTPIPTAGQLPYPHRGLDFYDHHPFDWGGRAFSVMGIPVCNAPFPGHGVRTLCGKQVDFFTDEQIEQLLKGKLWLDGEAALLLAQRGFAPLIGVMAENKKFMASHEIFKGNLVASFSALDQTPFLTPLPGAECLSQVVYSHFKGDATKNIMPGCVYFNNDRGGKVITWAMTLSTWHDMNTVNPMRKLMFLKAIEKMQDYQVRIPACQHCNLFSATCGDGTEIQVITNYSYDPLKVTLEGIRQPKTVEKLTTEATFKNIPFTWKKQRLVTREKLEPAQAIIIRITF